MYQAAVRAICGIERHGTTIAIDPCVPTVWPEFRVDWTIDGTPYRFVVSNPEHWSRGVASATLDGRPVDPAKIPLIADGTLHEVHVRLGPPGQV
jgi:cellobiose phosphorylase